MLEEDKVEMFTMNMDGEVDGWYQARMEMVDEPWEAFLQMKFR